MTAPNDSWHRDAMIRLTRHILRDASRARDFAPDARYDATTRTVVPGPKSMHIADVLHRWALMWAADMREARSSGIDLDQDAQWAANMLEAHAEIDRYLLASKQGAAA